MGILSIKGETFWTAERPWMNNQRSISCIPSGTYQCKRYSSKRFGETFEITDVPDRTYILFHAGNYPIKDSEGCVLIGEEKMGDTIAVSNSRKAVNRFRELLKDTDEFTITVRESAPHDWS
jgi:hypothetical protein